MPAISICYLLFVLQQEGTRTGQLIHQMTLPKVWVPSLAPVDCWGLLQVLTARSEARIPACMVH